MNDSISLLKPVSDSVYSALDEDQIRFFATIGINFCLGIFCSSFVTLQTQYSKLKEAKSND